MIAASGNLNARINQIDECNGRVMLRLAAACAKHPALLVTVDARRADRYVAPMPCEPRPAA
jgi:hypothetical protein